MLTPSIFSPSETVIRAPCGPYDWSLGEMKPGASAPSTYRPAVTPVKRNCPAPSVLTRIRGEGEGPGGYCSATTTFATGSPFNVTRPEIVAVPALASLG